MSEMTQEQINITLFNECKMKDARIDWTVADNVKKALEIDRLEKEVKRLWGLLDDISTAGDMFKPEINGYFEYVNRKCEERHGMVTTDGYKLTITPASETTDSPVSTTAVSSAYGNCPYCGAHGISRERRPNGNDECENSHVYPSRDAVA